MDFINEILNISTLLVLLGAGTIIWIIRQILPDKIENRQSWKVVLRVLPVLLGAILAAIPGLRPVETNLTQSIMVGFVCGSLSSNIYGFIRAAVPANIKKWLGSRSSRLMDVNDE